MTCGSTPKFARPVATVRRRSWIRNDSFNCARESNASFAALQPENPRAPIPKTHCRPLGGGNSAWAAFGKGRECARRFFVRTAGIVQTPSPSSVHSIPPTSSRRCPVRASRRMIRPKSSSPHACQTLHNSASVRTLAREGGFAGLLLPATGFAGSSYPSRSAQLNIAPRADLACAAATGPEDVTSAATCEATCRRVIS